VHPELRPLEPERFGELVAAIDAAFGDAPRPELVERWREVVELDRAVAVADGGRIVGGATVASMRVSAPGGDLPMAGITALGVAPTHRRRGLGTAIVRRCLEGARERGEPVAGLWASESRIYGRHGFGIATRSCSFELETAHAGFDRPVDEAGEIVLLPEAEAFAAMGPIYEALRPAQPGMPARPEAVWPVRFHEDEAPGDPPLFYAVHEGSSGRDAYAAYRVRPDWSGGIARHTVEVEELLATTPGGWAAMWRFVLDLDLAAVVLGRGRPPDDPLWSLLADPRRMRMGVRDGMWLRAVDVAAALSGRRYGAEDALVLEVRDPACPWNDGRFLLEGGPDGASCRPTDRDPDLALEAAHLGGALLGGGSFGALLRAGAIVEERPGAAARADRMFRHAPAPWCPGEF
jgi:predicted acetyltransferase